MGKLDGKVAIVTGASKGIGAGIALRLAQDGARVVVNYARSADEAAALVRKIEAAGGQATAVQADVSQPAEIGRLFEKALAAYGQVDVLVNNAGIYEFADLASITPESIDRQFGLNVKGLILATQAAARVFPPAGGVVVNISSGAGIAPIAQAADTVAALVDQAAHGAVGCASGRQTDLLLGQLGSCPLDLVTPIFSVGPVLPTTILGVGEAATASTPDGEGVAAQDDGHKAADRDR